MCWRRCARCRRKQRAIAVDDERDTVTRQCRKRDADRVAGAARRGLNDAGQGRDRARHRIAVAAAHDYGLGRHERAQRVDDVANHRLPGNLVQNLGARRFEAGPLAGGENDGGETGSLHGMARAKARGERNRIIKPRLHARCSAANTQIVAMYERGGHSYRR